MSTISIVCNNLFTQTVLAKTERLPCRGVRRNVARIIYRQARRPGIHNPLPKDQLPERPAPHFAAPRKNQIHKPMRHVYKLRIPPAPKKPLAMWRIPKHVDLTNRVFRDHRRAAAAADAAAASKD